MTLALRTFAPHRNAANIGRMFIRFVVANIDDDSGRRQGLFQAGDSLRMCGEMSTRDANNLDSLCAWFEAHLPVPSRFSVSSKPHAKAQALSWFHDTATEHISKMRDCQCILDNYGLHVTMLKTKRPGYIVFEDLCQVVAYPFADTPT